MQSGLKDVFKKVVIRGCFIGITEKSIVYDRRVCSSKYVLYSLIGHPSYGRSVMLQRKQFVTTMSR